MKKKLLVLSVALVLMTVFVGCESFGDVVYEIADGYSSGRGLSGSTCSACGGDGRTTVVFTDGSTEDAMCLDCGGDGVR
ncbi:MAG: hypothetical protein LBV20_05740 [Treponema sp.]|jgi:DnaJ-class molecular chaperone|nr:hypothetical protein [Treponema sp.]